MKAVVARSPEPSNVVEQLLLRHCLAFNQLPFGRPTAQARLEAELGPDLARRLVRVLTVGSRG